MPGPNFLIYALLDPLTDEVRYVGQTTYGEAYLKKYFHPSFLKKKRYVASWIKSLHEKDLKPIVKILEENIESKDLLNERERYFISHYKSIGCKLTNLAEGGSSNSGFKMSEAGIEALKKRDRTNLQKGREEFFNNNLHPKWHNNPKAEEYKEQLRSQAKLGGQRYAEKYSIKIQDENGNIYKSQKEAALKLNVSASEIYNFFKGKCKAVKGHTFKLV